MDWKLISSNENKLNEFKRFGLENIGIEKGIDIKEVKGTDLEVIFYKSKEAGPFTIVDDTSLEVEGADIGNNIRWLLDDLDKHVGKKCVWKVLLGLNDGDKIYIYEGKLYGEITSGINNIDSFGFDSLFLPEGYDLTLSELEYFNMKDEVSARKKAVSNLINGSFISDIKIDDLPIWNGEYQ